MKILLSVSMSILFCIPLTAQNLSLSSPEVFLQARAFHQEDSYAGAFFRTNTDFGLGIRWDLTFNPALSLSFGGMLNHANFNKIDRDNTALYYIDYFKSQEFHYFNLKSVSQWSAEIPLILRWSSLELGDNKLGFFIGGSPQFFLASTATGSGFDGEEVLKTSLNSNNLSDETSLSRNRFISDLFLQSGVYLRREILTGRSLILETGYEYSTFANSNGMVLRLGYRF